MRRQLVPALVMVIVFTVITGLAYPLLVTGIAQAAFNDKANGSLIEADGTVVGSRWIGQAFTKDVYFHPRPSAAGDGYDGASSSGTNKGPTNPDFLNDVKGRVDAYRAENHLGADVEVPVDAVTASGSGLDPEISVANANIQAARVADARHLAVAEVMKLVKAHTEVRSLGFLGESGVNVLTLNVAVDQAQQ